MSTRTHVYHFGQDDVDTLEALVDAMEHDWLERRVHVPLAIRASGDARAALLRSAVTMCREPAD